MVSADSFYSEIRNRKKMSVIITSIQFYVRGPGQCTMMRKRKISELKGNK